MSLRLDDRPILDEIRRWTGIGRVYTDKKGRATTTRPCAAWSVESRDACAQLVSLFERYPLRAKKARDFEVWSRAVREWMASPAFYTRAQGWATMEALAVELREGREFRVAA